MPNTLLLLFLSLALVALNGFFVAAEFAIVRVRRTRLEELAGKGVHAASSSIRMVDHLDEFLSTTQLGVTVASLALGWVGEEAITSVLLTAFPNLNQSPASVRAIAIAAAFLLLTLLHVVLGELVPKGMAINKAENTVLRIARPLRLFNAVTRPLIRTFTLMANWVLRRLGYGGYQEDTISEDELRIVMRDSREDGVISESEAQIITRAFEFSDKCARDIMVPRMRLKWLSDRRTLAENLAVIRATMHSRYPLCAGDLDHVIGIVHVKDAWPLHAQTACVGTGNEIFTRSARTPVFVEPGMREDQLLKLMRERRTHVAIVRDNQGRTLGIVTLEDILEELVGEIRDEHGH